MELGDVLTSKEVDEYHEGWKEFDGKDTLETKYNVHSSKPVISKVYVFRGPEHPTPVLRARVFQKELREFDPYFKSAKYGNPFWHVMHYIMATEQMYHAGSNMLRDNSQIVVKDTLEQTVMKAPIFWSNKHKKVSVELIPERLPGNGKGRFLFIENSNFRIYEDRENQEIAQVQYRTYAAKRAYIRDLEALQAANGNREQALEALKRKIQMMGVRHEEWAVDKRGDLHVSAAELIDALNTGKIPEEKLHDFFSLWSPHEEELIVP